MPNSEQPRLISSRIREQALSALQGGRVAGDTFRHRRTSSLARTAPAVLRQERLSPPTERSSLLLLSRSFNAGMVFVGGGPSRGSRRGGDTSSASCYRRFATRHVERLERRTLHDLATVETEATLAVREFSGLETAIVCTARIQRRAVRIFSGLQEARGVALVRTPRCMPHGYLVVGLPPTPVRPVRCCNYP